MRIVTSIDSDFNFFECRNLYNINSEYMNNNCSFEDIVYNSHFYSFYEGKKLLGCIYIDKEEDGKLFLNGFSIRKNHKKNIEAINRVVKFYNCAIFAKTKNRTAEFLLKKCGFELFKTDENKIKYLKRRN